MKYWLFVFLFPLVILGCKKTTESSASLGLEDIKTFDSLKIGRVYIYRMDSATPVFGKFDTTHYLAKDSVVDTFLDNQGRNCYTIFRYLTDPPDTFGIRYQYRYSYYIAYDVDKIETVDPNNYRFINLANPVSLNTSWKGNSYLDSSQSKISDNTSYAGWVYQYTAVNKPFTVIGGIFPNTCTVIQDSVNSGPFVSTQICYETYSKEVYAKGIGLIYKEITDYFNQAPPSLNPGIEDNSFFIRLNLVSYK